ncbi:hypothetical protein K491DRAFT_716248 [Lophiostoma macrostomum CBS 122681]|uniref:Transcription factor domain-containing protein n=1 Tax=Lophiostoma macrostomum CBS 122681 TaxID=1314788 RepID=A0A6A6T6F9_9PLEO|nr:hypothetical protein K491DRAFT_716248 [Lophiostoma macrostomum CBS 122681]
MSPTNDAKGSKKRAGRKRLPPLPAGPPLQFVVASHPDQFKANDTMRNIRSHVMYKHRGEHRAESPGDLQRGESSRHSMATTRTPSPTVVSAEEFTEDHHFLAPPSRHRSTIWDKEFYRIMSQSPSLDPIRNLAARIIAVTTAEPARSAPPSLDQGSEYPFPSGNVLSQESLEDLKHQYLLSSSFCQDPPWMTIVCSTHMSFLCHVSVACVFQDLTEGFLEDTPLTVYAKTNALRMIKDSLQGFNTSLDDFTILSILHLLISEVGSYDEDVFDVHHEGLVHIVHQRGGLSHLGLDGSVATFLIVLLLTFAVIRSQSEPTMLQGFVPSRRQSMMLERPLPVSPLLAPHGDLSILYGSCSEGTYQILVDMHELTRIFILRWNYVSDVFSPQASLDLASYDAHMQQIYARMLLLPPINVEIAPDWVYEACRLAALIYCRSIVQGVPFSESGNVMHSRGTGTGLSNNTVVSALLTALDSTDTSGFWGSMSGVFLWVCLLGGAASWTPSATPYEQGSENDTTAAWVRKSFALYAVKTVLECGFENAGAIVQGQRTMLQVQSLIDLKRGISSQ